VLPAYNVSPMQARPDTPARLAVEDRGMAAVIAAAGDPDTVLATIMCEQYPALNASLAGIVLRHTTIQN
jgi:hypothetical protein